MAEKIRKSFKSLKYKNYENALMNLLLKECRFLGGPKVLDLIVREIVEITNEHFVLKEHLQTGEMLWTAVTTDVRNASKKMLDTKKKVVKLPVADQEKIHDLIGRVPMKEIRKKMTAKFAKTAYEQGTTLSCSDVAAIMTCSPSTISKYSREIAEEEGEPLPLRGFVHDLGPSLSHRIPVVKEYLRGQMGKKACRKTKHSQKASDRYIRSFEKVKLAKKYIDDLSQISYLTGHPKRLVREYIFLMEQFDKEVEKNKNEL
jgi:hypothetical protein